MAALPFPVAVGPRALRKPANLAGAGALLLLHAPLRRRPQMPRVTCAAGKGMSMKEILEASQREEKRRKYELAVEQVQEGEDEMLAEEGAAEEEPAEAPPEPQARKDPEPAFRAVKDNAPIRLAGRPNAASEAVIAAANEPEKPPVPPERLHRAEEPMRSPGLYDRYARRPPAGAGDYRRRASSKPLWMGDSGKMEVDEKLGFDGTLVELANQGRFGAAKSLCVRRWEGGEELSTAGYNQLLRALKKSWPPQKSDLSTEAAALYKRMLANGVPPNTQTYNELINCHGRGQSLPDAVAMFDACRDAELVMDLKTWCSLLSAYGRAWLGLGADAGASCPPGLRNRDLLPPEEAAARARRSPMLVIQVTRCTPRSPP
mmetsp:Transcript_27480/g.88124  ORF Transcript_27480/g.88124 Transcript_27480/m.88124 type:complete len:374 (-) Transcript_27480:1090-2211(-)